MSAEEIIFSIKNKTTTQIEEKNLTEHLSILYKEQTTSMNKTDKTSKINGQYFLTTNPIKEFKAENTSLEKPEKNYDQNNQYFDEIEFSICNGIELDLASCDFDIQSVEFKILFTSCNIPNIISISPKKITHDSVITIKGKYFSKNPCENEVYINGAFCRLISSTSTSITCKIGRKSGLIPKQSYQIEVLVKNKGYALHNDLHEISFLPAIWSVTPKKSKYSSVWL